MAYEDKQLKRAFRELAGRAYAEELRRALLPLAESFDAWRAGRLDVWELNDRIHEFHQGPARSLWNRYADTGSMTPAVVAHAIATGILDRSTVPPEVLDHLANAIGMFEREEP